MKVLLVAINAKYIHSNLAVYCLKTYAEKYSHAVKTGKVEVDYSEFTINQKLDEILEEIYLKKPKVIGFSCYIWNISYVKALMRELKVLLPDTDIWLGGPEVSYSKDEILADYPEAMGVLCGEGEQIFADLCDYYGDGAKGIFDSTPRKPIDLSELPFIYATEKRFPDGKTEFVENDLFCSLRHKIIYYESSRGCPFSCSYCLSSIDKTLRFRNIDNVLREVQFFIDQKVSQVKFVDRTFNCKKEHAIAIWKYLEEHDNGITNFHFEIGADLLDDEEISILKKMRPGLVQLEIGVQSTNDVTIQEVSRKMNLERLKEMVIKLRSFGNINLHLDLIAGLPYEDFETFQKSFNEIYALQADQLQLGFLKVLKGSAIAQKSREYGIVSRHYPPYEVLYTDWLSFDEVLKLKLVEDMVEQYYNSGQFVFSLKYIQRYFNTPFELFQRLGEYYERHYEKNQKHARIDRYRIFIKFFEELLCKDSCFEEKRKVFCEIMIFDLYLRENMKTRPDFAADMKEYREIFRRISKELAHTGEHIEVISFETWKELKDLGVRIGKRTFDVANDNLTDKKVLCFDYQNRNPLNHNAAVYEVCGM